VKRLTVVESSMVHAVGYDRVTRTMEVVFNDGGIFFYQDVPRAVYEGLLAADSKGRYMRDSVIDTYVGLPLAQAVRARAPAARGRAAKPRRRT
jgi:hypothetical protein